MSTIPEILAGTAVEIVLFGLAGGLLYRAWRNVPFLPQRRTLLPFNKGVVVEGERVVRVLEPGNYWIRSKHTIVPVDVRPRPFQTALRDLLTADGQGIRLRFSGQYKVVDVARFIGGSSDGHAAFYLALEREIPFAVADLQRADILSAIASPADRVKERIEPVAAQMGIELVQLDGTDLMPVGWLHQHEVD